jgi:hypothetical protein
VSVIQAAEFRIRREMSAGFLSNFSSATWSFLWYFLLELQKKVRKPFELYRQVHVH